MIQTVLGSVAIIAVFSSSACQAENPASGWMKYLEGESKYELSNGKRGEITWKLEAGREAMVGQVKEGNTTAVELGGYQPD